MTAARRSVATAIRDALLTGDARGKVFAARQVARTLEGVPNAFEPLSSPATSRHASEGRLATESAM